MCRGHDPFLSGQSALPSLPIYHQCAPPPFSIFREKNAFSALFWSKFQLLRCKFSKFSFPRPLIFQGKSVLLTLLFETCEAHTPQKKLSGPPVISTPSWYSHAYILFVQRCSPLPTKFNFDFIFTLTQLLYHKILQIMNTF